MATTKVRGELVDLNEATSESGLKIPSGTLLNRPTASEGMIRNNTNEASEGSASCEEYYNGTEWKKINNVAIPPIVGMSTLIYSGNGSTQSLTGLGFKPDLVWIKNRNGTNPHGLWDSTRGAGKLLVSNTDAAESGNAGDLMGSFDADGFQVNRNYLAFTAYDNTNWGAGTYVGWAWKANGGTTSSNTDGNITSTVQVNQAAGFSIVQYTGTGSNVQVGHGLGTAPTMVIFKNVSDAVNWYVWTSATGSLIRFEGLNTDSAAVTSGLSTTLGASTIDFTNTGDYSASGKDYIMYCFAEISRYSKFGTYTGNGSTQSITGLGFQPGWVLIKSATQVASWQLFDSARGATKGLNPNDSAAEFTNANMLTSFDTDGFSLGNQTSVNANTETYIYMAFLTA